MDFGKALTFIMEDPRWQQKIAIGTGLVIVSSVLSVVLIGVLGFLILMGYCVRLLQNVRDGQPYPLPEWDQWGDDLVRGLKLFVVMLVWSLPALVLTIPTVIGSTLLDPGSGDAAEFVGSVLLICGSCLVFLYALFLAVATPGFTIAFARDEQISSGLQFRQIWDWTQDHLGQVVIVAVIAMVAGFVIGLVGAIAGALLCLIGLIVTVPLASLVTYLYIYHLYGQLAYAYPMGGGRYEPLTPVTPPSEMAPGVTPVDVPPAPSTPEYPGSGITESPTPPTPPATPLPPPSTPPEASSTKPE